MATGGAFRIPQLAEYDVSPKALKFANVIVAATSSDEDEDIISDTQETVNVFQARTPVYVYDAGVYIETAFTASVTLTLGDSDNTAGWKSAVAIGATSTGIGGTSDSDVFTSDEQWPYTYNSGKFYPADQTIDLVVGGANPAVGRARVWILYADAGLNKLSTSSD